MATQAQIDVPVAELERFCTQNHIQRLSFFGSVIREDFGPNSDIDVLVEFDPAHVPGLIALAGLELELEQLLGRSVDLLTPGFFRPALRQTLMKEAVVQYDEGR